ncbi:MAG: energy-coupled thiamine transporter ThiT [Clostridia bacterium]|nr:energy-coupled thiamine transporter ThiT [Clostridia bacterium]
MLSCDEIFRFDKLAEMFDFRYVGTNPWFMVLMFAVIVGIGVALYFLSKYVDKKRGIERTTTTKELVFGAVCIALSFVLSMIRIFRLANAGSVTLASIFPIALYCYVFGFNKSMVVCFVFSLLNFCQGPYVISVWSALLDYLLPYLALSLVGIFAVNPKTFQSDGPALKKHGKFFIGLALYFIVRLASHTLAGMLFWSQGVDFWVFEGDLVGWASFAYSLTYNLAYLLPDTVVAGVVAVFLLSSKGINREIYKLVCSTKTKKTINSDAKEEEAEAIEA